MSSVFRNPGLVSTVITNRKIHSKMKMVIGSVRIVVKSYRIAMP
jgi:hypothetical protein